MTVDVSNDLSAAVRDVTAYKLELELLTADGRRLRRLAIEPDWEPVFESICFDAVRRGLFPPVLMPYRSRVEPIWHGTLGAPYVRAFRALVMTAHGLTTAEVPVDYLSPLTRAATAQIVAAGEVEAGTSILFLACAYAFAAAPPDDRFAAEAIEEDLDLRYASLRQWSECGRRAGRGRDGEMPVFLDQSVLDDAIELARAAATVEVGGVLVGQLCRDPEIPEIFPRVTALIPARHAVEAATRVTFTAETWAAVDAAIALRGRGERKLGWFHFHPSFCAPCPEERRALCTLGAPFFSADDVHLHRVCFSRAYHVALLITDTPRHGLLPTLYGWNGGTVGERAFYSLSGDCSASAAPLPDGAKLPEEIRE